MIIKCKMCGGDIDFTPGATYGTCEYCGSTSTIPKAEDEQKLNRYNRANHFRRQCEFDKALSAYEKILEQDDTDAEAHWGAVLSRYGIEYVEDPATRKRIPTCHRVQIASILADADYLAAVENAPDGESRRLYEEQAAQIADIQKGILAISANEKPYDVFICYKETDESGQRTRDSQWAQDVYYGLTDAGYKVFFSRITLEDKLGQQYEPYIFAALNSAKVMVVIGSKPEYFSAVWVKNEWSRYLSLMAGDRKRLLIPCYRDMDPYDLPEELSNLQSQDMSKIGFMQDLLRGVKKVLDADKTEDAPHVVQQVVQSSSEVAAPGVSSLMERAYLFMEDGDFSSAGEYLERVLDIDPKYAPAYAAKVCIALGMRKESQLAEATSLYEDNADWQKALRFANDVQKATYLSLAEQARQWNAYNQADSIAKKAWRGLPKELEKAASFFSSIPSYKDAQQRQKECLDRAEAMRNQLYNDAVRAMTEAKNGSFRWEWAITKLSDRNLDGYRDVAELLRQAEEQKKLAREKAQREAEAEAKRKRRNDLLALSFMAVAIAIILLVTKVFIPKGHYDKALQFQANGQWEEAVAAFAEAGEYSDAATQVFATYYLEGETKRNVGDWEGAVTAFENAGYYNDATTQVFATYYLEGETKREAGDWEGAVTAFENAGEYSDAATQITETYYQQAQLLMKAGDYNQAYALFKTMKGYADVDSLLANDENLAAAARKAMFAVGNYVTFGTYPQTKAGNDKTPIEWLVLDRDGEKALLLSRYGLDTQPYNEKYVVMTWEKSNLRKWLNDDFMNRAFTEAEQSAILLTNVDNSNSQGYSRWSTSGGNNTQDKLFLLSYAEANKYLGVTRDNDNNIQSRIAPTGYAIAQGAYTSDSNKTADGEASGWWWLRSPGFNQSSAAYVYTYGSLNYSSVDYGRGSVRPALWVNLESGIF